LKKYFFILIIIISYACNKKGSEDAIAARVGDKYLYWTELGDIIPNNASPEDSIMLCETYVNNWIREQVVLKQAEENLAEEKKDFEELIRLRESEDFFLADIIQLRLKEWTQMESHYF
jgi:hypothetical protein